MDTNRIFSNLSKKKSGSFDQSSRTIDSERSIRNAPLGNRIKRAAGDAAFGVGQMITVSTKSLMPGKITPPIWRMMAGSARAIGGIITLATSGARIFKTYLNERASGATNFRETRKEFFVTGLSVGTSFAVGSASGFAVAGVAALGAPIALITAVAVAGVLGAGYTAHKTAEVAEGLFERWGR
ncbi:MAG TPA: hypothetical protein PKD37_05275 [Oligoflexia bacterium]|nr:hypothetical protein [Oligoflexia bacterium]HMP27378.1 hypothetical protein [Oligoflexia bacterium]